MGLNPKIIRIFKKPKTSANDHISQVAPSREVKVDSNSESVYKKTNSILDNEGIRKAIKLKDAVIESSQELYCPIRRGKIYCHSILVDKLGDLTRFILISLKQGHTVEEIEELTQMGSVTINEELDYLIKGGLIEEDRITLTDLGNQYGQLLLRFNELSAGIEVILNLFTNEFESIGNSTIVKDPPSSLVLNGCAVTALARNDNYSNSLEIASKEIGSEIPFREEILKSLYATVSLENNTEEYKRVLIKDYRKGSLSINSVKEPHITIAIPWIKLKLIPRYFRVDLYRDVESEVKRIGDIHKDLLAPRGLQLIEKLCEEESANPLVIYVNTINGTITDDGSFLTDVIGDEVTVELKNQPISISLDVNKCSDLYLEEVESKMLYEICYYPYVRLEN